MFSYLITFHMNNGHSYRSVLLAEGLDEVKKKVHTILSNDNGLNHFEMKDNKNVFFTILFQNISCIEFEMLAAESILQFDDLVRLKDETLKIILEHFKNDVVLGISLVHSNKELVEKFLSCLPEKRSKIIKDIIKLELGKIKMNDVFQAQEEVIRLLTNLYNEKKIVIESIHE